MLENTGKAMAQIHLIQNVNVLNTTESASATPPREESKSRGWPNDHGVALVIAGL
ncbi:MAG: hypothetical protein KDA91_23465 [Planctomycetaceae bacterium]|nr:hypothetical protein [Planctomycetaceae bacterium]